MIHALTILLALVVAAPMAGSLALPALAGLLIVVSWFMSEPERWKARMALPRAELCLLVLTAGLTVLAELTVAIVVGTGIGLALKLMKRKPHSPQWNPPTRGSA